MMSFSFLPVEIKLNVLSYIAVDSLDNCALVCQEWAALTDYRYKEIWDKLKDYFNYSNSQEKPRKLLYREAHRLNNCLEKLANLALKNEIVKLGKVSRLI